MSLPLPVRSTTAGPDERSPSGFPRSIVVLLGLAAAVVLAAGVKATAAIVAPTMLALVLAIAVLPVRTWAGRRGCPGWLSTLLALIGAYLILAVLVFGTVVCLIELVELLPQYAGPAHDLTDQLQQSLLRHGLDSAATGTALEQFDPAKLSTALSTVLSGSLGFLSALFFLITLMFFVVTAVPGFGHRMNALARSKPAIARSITRFTVGTQRYLVMTALFGAIVAALDAAALWLLAVPLPLVWGFFSFLTNFIPNIGFVLGIVPPAVLALLDAGLDRMLLVITIYSALNVTIQTFIQPRYVGASVGLSAEITFLSLVVWAFLLGPLGAVLAVPMTLLVRALFLDPDPRAAWALPLIATTAEPDPQFPVDPADAVSPAAEPPRS